MVDYCREIFGDDGEGVPIFNALARREPTNSKLANLVSRNYRDIVLSCGVKRISIEAFTRDARVRQTDCHDHSIMPRFTMLCRKKSMTAVRVVIF